MRDIAHSDSTKCSSTENIISFRNSNEMAAGESLLMMGSDCSESFDESSILKQTMHSFFTTKSQSNCCLGYAPLLSGWK